MAEPSSYVLTFGDKEELPEELASVMSALGID